LRVLPCLIGESKKVRSLILIFVKAVHNSQITSAKRLTTKCCRTSFSLER
jgi:hypothetical protein